MASLNLKLNRKLEDAIEPLQRYEILRNNIYFDNQKVAELYQRSSLFKKFLQPNGISYSTAIFNKLLPWEAVLTLRSNTLYLTEIATFKTAEYIYRKLQTCDFKNRQYSKLLEPLGIKVKYVYILNEWFKKSEYKDVLNYVKSVGCYYFFHELPLSFLGLPEPTR